MIYEKAMLKDSHFYCVESYSVKKKKKSNVKPASSRRSIKSFHLLLLFPKLQRIKKQIKINTYKPTLKTGTIFRNQKSRRKERK